MDFISNPKRLRKRLIVVGLAMLLLSPFLVIFMLVYLFLRHAEQFYNHPSTASSRRWSNLSRWMFREFNEVDHLFRHRINCSVVHASEYLKQFPSPIISIIAKFISFVSGGFAAILIIIAFLEESLLEGQIFGRNLFWYAAVFGTITAVSRAAATDELLVLDPEWAMSRVVQHSHYMPKRWRGKENNESVRIEFETLYQYTAVMLLEEMASIFLTPLLLIFVLPKRVDDILQFIADFTINIEGVGHVCSFSAFDFQKHGNSNYGSPYNSSRTERSSQGKMEKSFLSFQSSFPSWEPDDQGRRYLQNLRNFSEQMSREQGPGHAHAPSGAGRGGQNLVEQGDRNVFSPSQAARAAQRLDFLWLTDSNKRSLPYLLDWYYSTRPNRTGENPRETPEESFETTEGFPQDYWVPPDFTRNEATTCGDYWGNLHEGRSQGHVGASTSAPSFPSLRASVFHGRDSDNVAQTTRSHWWARSSPHDAQHQASFLEPPDFNQQAKRSNYDYFSDRSSEEQEPLDWRNFQRLAQTKYADDFEEADISLHFDDVYSRPPETPRINPDPGKCE